jgi:hypothetical protein
MHVHCHCLPTYACTKSNVVLVCCHKQGDRIGPIFDFWAIVFFGPFNLKISNASEICCLVFLLLKLRFNIDKKIVALHFGRFFYSQTHLGSKKLSFFSKTHVMITILHNLALFWVKNANFLHFFRRKYFKNRSQVPLSGTSRSNNRDRVHNSETLFSHITQRII